MKKQLNSDVIASELRGNSAFFPGYKETPAPVQSVKPAALPAEAKPVAQSRPVPPVRVVPPVRGTPVFKRVMKQRHPFDIYRDQYEALQQLSLDERKQGGMGSMSAMVREAIDAFIEKHRKK
jgi:hypothetical protein